VSQAGRYMVSGCAVGTVKLWSLTEGMQLDMQPDAHPGGCSSLGFLEPSIVSHPDLLSLVFSCSTWHSHVAAHHRQQTTHTYILHSRQTPAQVLHDCLSAVMGVAQLNIFHCPTSLLHACAKVTKTTCAQFMQATCPITADSRLTLLDCAGAEWWH